MENSPIYNREEVSQLIKLLLKQKLQIYIACAGSGAGIGRMFSNVPDVSRILAGAHFAYKPEDFSDFIGQDFKTMEASDAGSLCSFTGAIALAQTAFFKAQKQAWMSGKRDYKIIALGLTAAVATSRPLRGGTRVFLVVKTYDGMLSMRVDLKQGHLDRIGDGDVCDVLGLNMILHAAGLPQIELKPELELTSLEFETLARSTDRILKPKAVSPMADFDRLLSESSVYVDHSGTVHSLSPERLKDTIIFPGSFNPFTFGHDELANYVHRVTGQKIIFEISAGNVDKPSINDEELLRRAGQFSSRWPVILTKANPLFVDKINAYGVKEFIVGYDTMVRFLDPKYYDSPSIFLDILGELRQQRAKFYVADRIIEGKPQSIEDAVFGDSFNAGFIDDLLVRIPIAYDVSSTAIRNYCEPR